MKYCKSFFAALVVFAVCLTTAQGQSTKYWDLDGGTPGAGGGGSPSGTWDTSTPNWNLDLDGDADLGGATTWTAGDAAVFSAGGDAGGTFTVTLDGTQTASGVTFDEGTVTLAGGQLELTGAATVSVPFSSLIGRIDSVIGGEAGLNATGTGVLILGGSNIYTGAGGGRSTTTIGTATEATILRLGASGAIPDTSVVVLTTGQSGTTFQLNGNDETVGGVATSGTSTAPLIVLGQNTLTLEDTGEDRTVRANFSSNGTANDFTVAHGRVIKNGSGRLVLNNFNTNFTGGEFIVNDGIVGISQNNSFGPMTAGSKLVINGGTFQNTGTGGAGSNWGVRNVDINDDFTMDLFRAADTQLVSGSGGTNPPDSGNTIITLGAVNPTITVIPHSSGTGTFIFAGRVLNNAPGEVDPPDRGFTKAGDGVLILGNRNNDYRGATTILDGTLRLRNQFLNINSFDNNGPARIGDGTGAVNLSAGTLEYNGSPVVEGASGAQATTGPRSMTVSNPINVTADSAINYFSTTVGLDTRLDIDFIFTSDSIGGTGGTLSLTHNGACAASPGCTFRPTFTGDGFDFNRPVVISNHTSGGLKVTQLVSANLEGTQTWSADISGTGGVKRTGSGGTTVLSGANTYAGGTTVDAGTLRASGASATFGDGNVTVSGGVLEIASGVADAIADTAMLSVMTGGMVNLGAGINDIIAALNLDGNPFGAGTYGSSTSGATNPGLATPDTYFLGTGILSIIAPGLPGDYNEDEAVDAADYVVWRKLYPDPTGPALPNDDTAGVDDDDYDRWVEHFGESNAGSGSGGSSAGVPEPGTLALAWLAFLVAGTCRRRAA